MADLVNDPNVLVMVMEELMEGLMVELMEGLMMELMEGLMMELMKKQVGKQMNIL